MNSRRKFLWNSAIAGTTFPWISQTTTGKSAEEPGSSFHEASRYIPIVRETDVIVCGGGPAGVAAAIQSARSGANTTLIEMYGCLGGVWTVGLLSNIIDYQDKPGIMREIVKGLEKSDAQYSAKVYDAEYMKVLLDDLCREAGVKVRLYTQVVAAYTSDKNRLEHIVTESFSGREAWKAKVFIDSTGNGTLSAHAGCTFDLGHPETGETQPGSLMAILTGLDGERIVAEGFTKARGHSFAEGKKAFWQEIKKAGRKASYTMPTLFTIRPGLVAMMANHEYAVSALDADSMTKHTVAARREVFDIVDRLRKLGGVWSEVRIVATGSQLGIREARRIRGRYTITADDLIQGSRFDDAVCRVTFNVDVHALNKRAGGGYGNLSVRAKNYDIPLRSLIAQEVDGLMMAGRCISGDFFAHASYRVTGNAVAMGEAAGKVAAQAALENKLPQEIKYETTRP